MLSPPVPVESHVFIYDEHAAQAAAIVANTDSISSSDFGIVTRQMASRASILINLDVPSACSWTLPPSSSLVNSAYTPAFRCPCATSRSAMQCWWPSSTGSPSSSRAC